MKETKIRIHHKKIKIIAVIIIVLIAARVALPYVVLQYANKSLANLKSLYGHIDDIDIALYRGAYKINDIYIDKKDSVSGNLTKFLWSGRFHHFNSIVGFLFVNDSFLRSRIYTCV